MALNPDKLSFGVNYELQTDLISDNVTIKNSKEEKVLEISFDNKLDFSPHLTSITKKANMNLNTLIRVQKYDFSSKRAFLISSFIKSQFN